MILFIPGCGRPMAPQGHQGCCTTKILLEPKHKRKEDQQKDASKVDSLSFYALSFNLRPFADAEPRKQFGCLEHSDLFTVTAAGVATECREVEYHRTLRVTPYDPTCLRTELKVDVPRVDRSRHPGTYPQARSSNPTTGFSTATTFAYAIGAGITAAAGTGLALQWFSAVVVDTIHHPSWGNPRKIVIFLRSNAELALWNLRACC